MTAKEYLEQYKTAELELQILNDKSELLKQSVRTPKAINYDKEPTAASVVNSTEQIILQYIEIEKDIDNKRLKLMYLRDEIVDHLRLLQDTRYFQVLYLRHIKQKRFWEIAKIMNYSVQNVKKLYSKALQELGNI